MDYERNRNICIRLLVLFQVAKIVAPKDITNLKVYTSQNYAYGPVYAFDYNNKRYYVIDDYSLNDDPRYVKKILLDINPLLKGNILRNATYQADGARYAEGLNGIEYYLWEAPLK